MNAIQHRHTIILSFNFHVRFTLYQIHVRTLIRPFLDISVGFLGWLLFLGDVESETTGEVRSAQWTRAWTTNRIGGLGRRTVLVQST